MLRWLCCPVIPLTALVTDRVFLRSFGGDRRGLGDGSLLVVLGHGDRKDVVRSFLVVGIEDHNWEDCYNSFLLWSHILLADRIHDDTVAVLASGNAADLHNTQGFVYAVDYYS